MLRNDVAHLCETWQSNTSGTAQASTELSPLFQDSAMVLDLQDWIRQSYFPFKIAYRYVLVITLKTVFHF